MSYTRGRAGSLLSIVAYGNWSCVDSRLTAASAVWPSANLAIYVPVTVEVTGVVKKLALMNGTAVSGNFDAGIYNAFGTRLVSSGSTAQSGTNVVQTVDVTDLTLIPGIYYLAACMDNTTGTTFRRSGSAPLPAADGVLTESLGSVVLPATASWAVDHSLAYIPGVAAMLEGAIS